MIVAGDHQHARHAARSRRRCRAASASPERSTPGPLPYQSPNTPSTSRSAWVSTCCEPSTAVAARSSFTAGRNSMRSRFSRSVMRQSSISMPPSGEPR